MKLGIELPLDPNDLDIFKHLEIFKYVPWLRYRLFGNELYEYALAIATFLILWGSFRASRWLILRRLKSAANAVGEQKAAAGASSLAHDLWHGVWRLTIPLIAFSLATQKLDVSATIDRWIKIVTVTILTAQVVTLANIAVRRYFWTQRLEGREVNQAVRASTQNIVTLIKIGFWIAGTLFVLDNIGVNISTFVAGLGIGGVAIALAAQAVLGDTFSSFAIAMDKPFEVGDFISIEGLNGTVEHVGFKTTRVRALSGELLVFSNSDMTKSRIRNFRKMHERRVHFRLGVVYQTSVELLAEIPDLIRKVVAEQPKCRFERASFLEFGDSSLNFDIVFWVEDPDYLFYANAHQTINLKIVASFAQRGIEFAYPTRTLVVTGRGDRLNV